MSAISTEGSILLPGNEGFFNEVCIILGKRKEINGVEKISSKGIDFVLRCNENVVNNILEEIVKEIRKLGNFKIVITMWMASEDGNARWWRESYEPDHKKKN